MDFIAILESIMEEKGLNQTELAKILGVKPSQVCEWLKGKNKPAYDKLKLICEKLDISGNRILGLRWNQP